MTPPPEGSPKKASVKPGASVKKSETIQKVIKKPKAKSIPKPPVPSAASQPTKRHRGKSPAAPPASEESEIEQLKKVGLNLG